MALNAEKLIWNTNKNSVLNKWKLHWINTHPLEIGEYSWNYLFTGGKQLRPVLFCELWKYLCPDIEVNYELAFVIECIHVASIVLDDTPWMDNADMRRGNITLHKYFSPKKAVLIAYDLIDMALQIWKNNKPSNITEHDWIGFIKLKLQRLMIGQWYDLEKKGNLIELASLKTGVLFEFVTETVAICIDLDRQFWKLWGNNLGILFQWVDDFQDREEDKIQNNRNALNEAYEFTINNYSYLWNNIKAGIGQQWFELEIGKFMNEYFTGQIRITDIKNNMLETNYYPENILIPDININKDNLKKEILNKKYYFNFINGKDMIKYIWNSIENFEAYNNYNANSLWSIDESKWEDHLQSMMF
jgi:hypothetical protein